MIWALLACPAPAPQATEPPAPLETADTAPPYDPWADGYVGDPSAGAAHFSLLCATCHGARGLGGLGPNLVPIVPSYNDLELYDIVTNGRDAMPKVGFESTQQAVDVIAFLRAQFPG